MHSICPYMMRCFNPASSEKDSAKKYSILDQIGSQDLFTILSNFMKENSESYKSFDEKKQVYRFGSLAVDAKKRQVYGWFEAGEYGQKNDIIDIETGKVSFEKTVKNATIKKHYFHIFVPIGQREAIVMLHVDSGIGIKTLFMSLFSPYFRDRTKLNVQMSPISYRKALNDWKNAEAKEIKVLGFKWADDLADLVRERIGLEHIELILKPARKKSFGKFHNFHISKTNQSDVIEILDGLGAEVKTVLEMKGKKRTFRVGPNSSQEVCEIEFGEDVAYVDGVPQFKSLNEWVTEIINEFINEMYPKMGFKL